MNNNICSPIVIEVEKEIVDNLSDFFADYETIDTLKITEKTKVESFLPIIMEDFNKYRTHMGAVTYYKAYYSYEEFTAIFNGKFKEVDNLIEKYADDEITFILYIIDTIYAKVWQEVKKD